MSPRQTSAFLEADPIAPTELIQHIDPCCTNQWDSWLAVHEGASFFHGTAWARVLAASYGYSPIYCSGGRGRQRDWLLPVMEVNSWLTGRRGISLPFTDECEVLGADPASSEMILGRLLRLAEKRRWKYLELRGGKSVLGDVCPSVSFYGHKLQLDHDPARLFSSFTGAVRTAVRKAEQGGLTVDFSRDMPGMRAFYQLLCKTRNRHGMLPQPFRFFENIYRYIIKEDKGCVVLAKLGNAAVAGAVFFHEGKNVLYKFAASDESFKHLQGNNLVLWKALEHYALSNFSSVDLGRTSLDNSGLRRFKLAWRALERQIDYFRYDRRANCFIKSKDYSTRGWHTRVFRSMPDLLSRAFGAAAYRHLA